MDYAGERGEHRHSGRGEIGGNPQLSFCLTRTPGERYGPLGFLIAAEPTARARAVVAGGLSI
jgi:hypothetical protein